MPAATSSSAYNPLTTGGYGAPEGSSLAGALGATGTLSGVMPGVTGNGTLATASPSVQTQIGAAGRDADSSLFVCLVVGLAAAMLVI